ncbi:MAG: pyrroline-5-carboxylate reductase [Okeania sp. SIO2D1]|uniref:pyrroline-5-carboxylate reductase n=1 Tax=Okeania sp. SIO2C9 TaxID=2607791 RepID=UPI0013BD7480|nr:pyrroline-5-carboxylate reductase [Okeania sp. SIO2C9]NEQ76246.1 pyrroline-5-carboxylate reductase [Okeania sp. SIO2C9]NES69098.1 pyrroline-5-carboxylate reductase [Okeania sp. SIO2D1]
MTTAKFGLIGGGVMGEALLSRLLEQKIYQPSEILVSDPQQQRRDFLAREYGVEVTTDNRLVVTTTTEALLLAVKPQIFDTIASELADWQVGGKTILVISIMAGVPLQKLEAAFRSRPMVRVMPNAPATVGAGMSAIALGKHIQPEHQELATRILRSVGKVVEVPETLMDAVTGLSGSGPGYVAILIESLTDGGVCAGLPRAIAYQLALQTVLGTAVMLQKSGMHPAELKDRVTSPGGTTIAGIAELESLGFRSALIEAVMAAKERSQELGNS